MPASSENSVTAGERRAPGLLEQVLDSFVTLRQEPPHWLAIAMGGLCVILLLAAWLVVTWGSEAESRTISPTVLPSPGETFLSFHALWFERALSRNLLYTLGRVTAGFALAAVVGIPLGVLAASFRPINAFLAPLSVFGRNIPIAALIPLTLLWFGIGETQKVAFIFAACVAFVFFDATRSISDVEDRYLDTAYTLGASRGQIIFKVLIPLALPDILNSLRLLFGLAFGYIMLSEAIDPGKYGGLGHLILMSQRRGPREHVFLILLFITLVAFGIDRFMFWCQSRLFPYRYAR